LSDCRFAWFHACDYRRLAVLLTGHPSPHQQCLHDQVSDHHHKEQCQEMLPDEFGSTGRDASQMGEFFSYRNSQSQWYRTAHSTARDQQAIVRRKGLRR